MPKKRRPDCRRFPFFRSGKFEAEALLRGFASFRSRMPPLQRRNQGRSVRRSGRCSRRWRQRTRLSHGRSHTTRGQLLRREATVAPATPRSAGPVWVSRLMVSNSNSNGSACCEPVGRLQAVPKANSRPCPPQRNRLYGVSRPGKPSALHAGVGHLALPCGTGSPSPSPPAPPGA